MSSATSSYPSGSKSKDKKLLPAAITMLTITKESLDGVPVLGLKAAVGGLLEILKASKRVGDNTQDLIELDAHLKDLSDLLTSINNNSKTDTSQEFNDRIAKLTSDIEKIVESCQHLHSQSITLKFLASGDNISTIKGINESISRAIRTFQLGGMVSVEQGVTRIEKGNTRIEERLDRLEIHPDGSDPLAILRTHTADARYDSSSRIVVTRCFQGTRSDLLGKIFEWADDPKAKPIYWLCGLAGTGKSTIAQTVSEGFHERGMLGASFFFSRDVAERSNPLLVFPTLALSLARYYEGFCSAISASAQKNPEACKAMLQTQMEKLIAKPLQDVTDGPSTVVIVIDALDECSNEPLVQEMIVLLASTIPKLPFRTRLFITSRPDVHIRSRFNDPALKSVSEASILHDIDIAVVQHDIGLYLDHHLRRIGKEMLGDESWPSQSDIDSLTERAKGLFIYASASIAYIEDKEHREPKERLNRLLDDISDGGESPFADIDKLYRYILNSSLPKRNAQEVAGRLRAILGAIVLLQDPLSSSAMEKLISMSEGSIRPTIIPLHAVLSVPDDVKEPIRVFHQSFPDFMVDYRRCNNPHLIVDPPVHHTHLALHCINLMNLSLCRNMCGLVQDYIIPNADIPNLADILEKNVGSHILYACRFWATHLRQADATNESLRIALSDFVNTKTIYWLEIMSLLGQLDTALTSLHDAMKWYKDLELEPKQLKVVRKLLPVTEKMGLLHQYVQSAERKLTTMHAPIKSLLYDYQRLLLRFYEPMSLSATNIYLSALPFIPHCLLYQQIKGNMLRNSVRINQRETGWGPTLAILQGHSRSINSVCLSPDGTKIASGSNDQTVRVWDSTTGAHIRTLEGHSSWVNFVCFSPDGTKIASGSDDKTVQVWDSATGAHIGTLKGHSHGVSSVWFSPDGTKIASGSYDETVQVWDSTTGAHIKTLKGHSKWVLSVCFSPDGTKIASGSYDQTVQVWDSTTGAHIRTLKGHSNTVNSVCFSPDGTKIASGSDDNTVRVWDSTTGAHIGTLKGHSHGVSSVCFSPDGTKIAFGSYDETVQVWDSTTGAHIRTLKGHSHGVNSVWFSPDGTKIASGSYDQTVRVWDSTTGAHIRTLKGHSNMVNSVCFSPDGTKIASGSYDQTVQVWDSTTGAHIRTLKGHSNTVNSVCFSPDGTKIASGSDDNTVRVWDSTTGAHIRTLKGHSDGVYSMCFSPDGTKIASGSDDQTVRVWDSTTGAHIRTLKGHSYGVNSVCFSTDGTKIASGSYDQIVRVWDSTSGDCIKVLHDLHKPVHFVCLSPDGSEMGYVVWKSENGIKLDTFNGGDPGSFHHFSMDESVESFDALYKPKPSGLFFLDKTYVFYHQSEKTKYLICHLPFPNVIQYAFHNHSLALGTTDGVVWILDLYPAVGKLI